MSATTKIVLIAHNLRSTYNVGSLLRTADGLAVNEVWLTGHTPYPILDDDERLPHLARKIDARIAKTSLGAEKTVKVRQSNEINEVMRALKKRGFTVTALEQAESSVPLMEFKSPGRVALVVGREVEGLEAEVLGQCDAIVEIPMLGKKESFNVAVAAGMALYGLRFAA